MICEIIIMLISILISELFGAKLKAVPEKFFPIFIFLYSLISAIKIGSPFSIPIGFIICLIHIISSPNILNRKAKVVAIVVGLSFYIITIFV